MSQRVRKVPPGRPEGARVGGSSSRHPYLKGDRSVQNIEWHGMEKDRQEGVL